MFGTRERDHGSAPTRFHVWFVNGTIELVTRKSNQTLLSAKQTSQKTREGLPEEATAPNGLIAIAKPDAAIPKNSGATVSDVVADGTRSFGGQQKK